MTKHPVMSWWRRWAGSLALLLLVAVTAAGFAKVEATQRDADQASQEIAQGVAALEHETALREEQDCGLALAEQEERRKQLVETKAFLAGPAAAESTALVEAIRVALPKLEDEVKNGKENIPDICWKYRKGAS